MSLEGPRDWTEEEAETAAREADELLMALILGTTERGTDANGRPTIEAPQTGVLVTRTPGGITIQTTSGEDAQ